MTLRNILCIGALAVASSCCAAIGAMRSPYVGELAPYCYPDNAAPAPDFTFMPDGKGYVVRSDDGRSLVVRDIATGKNTETIFDLGHTRENTIADFEGFTLSSDASRILLWRGSEKVYRRSFTAEYWVYEVRSRLLRPLSKDFRRQRDPLFSPDSRMVAFVADGNIYAAKLDYETEVAVTTDGAPGRITNGATDWTYEEEFGTTALMAWAPDNLTLCYVRLDETDVPLYSLPIYAGTCHAQDEYLLYPGVFEYKYPVAGKPNSVASLQSYDVETRKTKTLDFPGGTPYYIPRIAYGPTPSQLIVAALNRDQNHFEVFCTNPRSTVSRSVYSAESKAWIEPMAYEDIYVGPASFVVSDDADGYTRLHEFSFTGTKLRTISAGDADITAYYGADGAGNRYYQAASPTPADRTIYRLDAKGNVTAVGNKGGTNNAVFAPDMASMLATHSSVCEVPVSKLCRADGRELRTIHDNAAYAAKALPLAARATKEFVMVPGEGGMELCGYIVKPADFSATKRYPVIMSQYSGPGSQQVLNRWQLDWEQYYASKGYVVICVDGRGTGGRGTAFRTAVYKNLGHYETIDQLAAARYAASLPYVDASRIGIYGWSYGGYEALMCASADGAPYAAAVAVAPVTDWRFYDTVYTERYMLTPQQNERGYAEASAIGHALHLSCPLLMMYGTADDNVHPANSLQYVSALQSAGIMCDMFVFPQMNHSINGCNARAVVYARMLSFFDSKLK